MHADLVKELDEWADKVVLQRASALERKETWVPTGPKSNNVSELFDRMEAAYKGVRDHDSLAIIAAAMRFWDGPERIDLEASHLSNYFKRGLRGVSNSKRKPNDGPPRWRTWAIVDIAAFILKHGRALRKALKLDGMAPEEVPTLHERLIGAEASVIELGEENAELKQALAKKTDAHRKSAERLKKASEAKRDAVRAAREAQVAKFEQKLADARQRAAAKTTEAKAMLAAAAKEKKAAVQKTAEAAAAEKAAKTAAKMAKKEADANAKAEIKERVAEAKERLAPRLKEAAEKRAAKDAAADVQKRAAEVARARERACKVEGKAKLYTKALKRAQKAEANEIDLKNQIDELLEQEQGESPDSPTEEGPAKKMARRDEKGRFTALPWRIRVLIWAQLARRVPPSAINANITDVLMERGEEVPPLPSENELKRMRNELTVGGECIAALRVALCKRIISFGFDESTKFGLGLLASNTQIEPHDAPGSSADVVLRGASLTAGGSSEEVAKSVDAKIFAHARRLLAGWKQEHEERWGKGTWAADGGPDPSQVGLHRLAEETLIMGDTCNGERKSKRIVAEAAEAAKRLEIGDEAWEAMSAEEREHACKSYIGDCHDHLRNIIISAMATGATTFLKDSLEDDLAEFSSFDRMSVDGMDLIRAIYKELHPGGMYAKGKGREGKAWREKVHPSAMWIPIYNAKGSRQDAAFDGSLSLFNNWNVSLDFLNGLVHGKKGDDSNKLELFLWRVHRCNQMRALARVNTLWKLVLTDAMRWLSGSAEKLKDWSVVRADRVLELAEATFVEIAADGRKLLDPQLDPFAELLDPQLDSFQPAFAAWRTERARQTLKAPDGTKYLIYEPILAEARSPTGAGNVQSTPTTIALAERMATAALTAMRDTRRAIAEKLTSQDGACAPAKRQRMHEATVGAHVNNSRCESIFGSYDYVGHIFRGASAAALGGLAQQMRNRDFERPPNVVHDRRKRKEAGDVEAPVVGAYHRLLNERLKESLVSYSRREAMHARKVQREDLAAHDTAKLARREERVIEQLNKAVEDYAFSKELFTAWRGPEEVNGKQVPEAKKQSQAAMNTADVDAFLKGKAESTQLEYLRKQIEMRTVGLGWTQFATRWSSNKDAKVGTVAHLRSLLIEIIAEEIVLRRLGKLPTEVRCLFGSRHARRTHSAPARTTAASVASQPLTCISPLYAQAALPQQVKRNLGQLGELDADAKEIEKQSLFSLEELELKTQAAMQRRVEAGIADSVEAMNGVSGETGAPAFNQTLVGKHIEVCWKYFVKDTNESMLIWSPGRVVRVADGLTDKRSPKARTVLPAGMILWAWDADPEFGEPAGEQWLALLPKKWNPPRQVLYGWRYDPREFAAPPTARDKRIRGMTRATE